ncbi:MAG: sodium/glutamate symporter [Phascolarctobacterium sp.]|nr:sodium/glutamate symporter [Phascolarctobacterium sp.]
MPVLHINFLLAGALAVMVYYLGMYLKKHCRFLRDYYIPAPVAGGLVFSFLNLMLHSTGMVHLAIDHTLQSFFMTMFFTSIGFAAKISFIKAGKSKLALMGVLCAVLVILQNIISLSITQLFGMPLLLGFSAGSVPMIGGHGSAGVFGSILEDLGIECALTYGMAMATLGLIMGGLLGGPLAGRLVTKYKLSGKEISNEDSYEDANVEDTRFTSSPEKMMRALAALLFAMGIGSIFTEVGKRFGITLPYYFGSVIIAAIMVNTIPDDDKANFHLPIKEINILADLSLNIYLALALMNLKIWQLYALAGPIAVIAILQIFLMAFYSYGIVFRILGRDYDAAVMVAALCGFGLGALPTGMANMNAITSRFGAAPLVYLAVPLISSLADCFNAIVVITGINLLK